MRPQSFFHIWGFKCSFFWHSSKGPLSVLSLTHSRPLPFIFSCAWANHFCCVFETVAFIQPVLAFGVISRKCFSHSEWGSIAYVKLKWAHIQGCWMPSVTIIRLFSEIHSYQVGASLTWLSEFASSRFSGPAWECKLFRSPLQGF